MTAPGRLRWSISLDVAGLTAAGLWSALDWLSQQRATGGLTLRVGDATPNAPGVDSRIPEFIAEAIERGVSIALDGTPAAVQSWWHAIRPQPAADSVAIWLKPRHLRVVEP